jgi:hypothetical protein
MEFTFNYGITVCRDTYEAFRTLKTYARAVR